MDISIFHQPSQHRKIGRVHCFHLRRFDNHWSILKTWVVGKQLERCDPDVAFADMFVAINPAAVLRLRIVEMERKQPIQSDNLVKLIKRPVIIVLRPQIVSRREDVTGIETDP